MRKKVYICWVQIDGWRTLKNNFTMKSIKLTLLLIPCLCTVNIYGQINNGLKAHYSFGGDANDISGQNNHGILIGNPTLTTDRFGYSDCAFHFPGDNSNFITIPYSSDFNIEPSEAFSLSLWFQGGTDSLGDFEMLFQKNNPAVRPYPSDYHLGLYDLNKPSFGSLYAPIVMPPDAPPIPDPHWHHVVGIYDNKKWYIYTNNLLQDSSLTQNYSIFQSTGDITIGKNFEGKIDDIRFFNRVLSVNEINQLYNMASTCQLTGLYQNYEKEIRVFPNPTSDYVTIEIMQLQDPSIEVFDLTGRQINMPVRSFENFIEINLTDFSVGMYLIRIINGDKILVERVLKHN